MPYRRSETQQVATGDPKKKHGGSPRGTNPAFEAGAARSRDANGGSVTLTLPLSQKPAKNKAAK